MSESQIIQADLTLIGEAFQEGVQVEITPDGVIGRVGKLASAPTMRLEGQALLPGMVNCHSHAFQRGLRGRGETFPEKAGNFWSWRDGMYALVAELDADTFHATCVQAYAEMLSAGITTVGEFHYLHHDRTCDGYAFDDLVLSAAKQTGIRIVLLSVYYVPGELGQPADPVQRRFASPSLNAYLCQVESLQGKLDERTQSQGLAVHSVRSAPIGDIVHIHQRAKFDKSVFHIQMEELPIEVDMCLLHHKMRPAELLLDKLDIGGEFTAVHATHTHAGDLARLIDAGAGICICPLSEANMGDGLCDVASAWTQGAHIGLGSGCNVRIEFNEEMRLLEYAQRLKYAGRGVCKSDDGDTAAGLWRSATVDGTRSLGVRAGTIKRGALADLIAIDLNAPPLAGWRPESLLTSFVLGADSRVVQRVCVDGKWLV